MSDSDFMKRLQAMREGKKAESAGGSSAFRERLNAKGPLADKANSSGSSADDIRARIQEKFKKKDASPPPGPPTMGRPANPPAASNSSAMSAPGHSSTGTGPLPEFEMNDIPVAAEKKEEAAQKWTPEDGGVCPNCGTFNLGHVAFCGSCEYLLLRTEEVVEIITSYPLSEIKGLVITFVQKLEKLKIKTTEDVLRVASRASNRGSLVKHTGMSERSLIRLVHQANFCRIPSLGPENAAMLDLIGITDVDKLLSFKPMEIYKKIQQAKIKLNQQGIMFLPTKNQVKLWFEEAADLPAIRIDG
jgi:hypothetical protein